MNPIKTRLYLVIAMFALFIGGLYLAADSNPNYAAAFVIAAYILGLLRGIEYGVDHNVVLVKEREDDEQNLKRGM